MNRIKDINSFEVNESVSYAAVDNTTIEDVKKSKLLDLGDKDTAIRRSILSAAYSLYSYFDKERDESKFVQQVLGMDQENKDKVLNSTKAYVATLVKISKIETDEVEPNLDGLDSIINI